MHTKKLNVYEEQRKWLRWHTAARATLTFNIAGIVTHATYTSPYEEWKDYIRYDGTVEVPDMDYYNSLTDIREIESAVGELKTYLDTD